MEKNDPSTSETPKSESAAAATSETKPETEHINLKVVGADNQDIFFKIKNTTRLEKLMQAYCDRTGCALSSVRFLFDGQRLAPTNTPKELEMEDGDTIDAMVEQIGGCLF
ncbi:Ubiquitin-like protein pmt3/smt3 [Smittium mucronatum]|uniref:Ubiquitin-like protein pmt3/smt3 n=1 Tax=Smittium mucronatum TaxID=133383 RepID=A0A1R0H536_9FUNG|nr:Ubiquitin-like protein pmt3/smt3 [Smittium mucronatum]